MFLVVGLGNPGKEYEGTNHNTGFYAISKLAEKLGTNFSKKMCKAIVAEHFFGKNKVLLAMPQTFMNLSGESVLQFVQKFKIPLKNVVIISDDIDLEAGKFRFRETGSAGTHNGLRNIIACLGSGDFKRIRIGIGKGFEGQDLADFVLSKVSKENKPLIEKATLEALDKIMEIISDPCGE
ncbi:MAG: aminoacyl-tRNA hydrolase [Clostridia bacterium]